MERALEERDIAERLQEAQRRRIALYAAAALSQQDERKIGPLRLPFDPLRQRMEVHRVQRFLRHQGKAGTPLQSLDQLAQCRADDAAHLGIREHADRHLRITAPRSQDQSPL